MNAFLKQFPVENVRKQYAENAKQLRWMESKSIEKGGKFNGFTTSQLTEIAAEFERLSKEYIH